MRQEERVGWRREKRAYSQENGLFGVRSLAALAEVVLGEGEMRSGWAGAWDEYVVPALRRNIVSRDASDESFVKVTFSGCKDDAWW